MHDKQLPDSGKTELARRSDKHYLCIYHGNCADGFGAAWVVKQWAESLKLEMDFHAGVYQDPPPDVTDKEVFIVDFSYKRPVLLEMASKAKHITIIDHHKTAQEDLKNLVDAAPNTTLLFNMNHSGAMLAWEWFFGLKEPPTLLKHIEDRDLWRFELPRTREIQATIFSYPYDFEVWDNLMRADPFDLWLQGTAIERKHFKDIKELIAVTMKWGVIYGHEVPVANLPYTYASDAGNIMAREYAPTLFAACYTDTKEGRVFSLRSVEGGLDVSAIAKMFGGGGHKNAAGFRISREENVMLVP